MRSGIGEFLRKERESRGVELPDVASATRIRGAYLKAIEAEEWDRLPGDAYARAFARTYASYLGVDLGSYMDEPDREVAGVAGVAARPTRRAPGTRRRLGLVVLACAAIAVAIAVAASLSGGGGNGGEAGSASHRKTTPKPPQQDGLAERTPSGAMALDLTATAELWVCLLDEDGTPLVDGVVLPEGSEEGPFRSGSFTVSFGNGEVEMSIDGRETEIPESASPLGYEIGSDGELSPLGEAERPTCT